MTTKFVQVGDQWVNPANVTRLKTAGTQATIIYFDANNAYSVQLSIDEVMRILMGLNGGPDTTHYGEPL